jgi:hypothetical protein
LLVARVRRLHGQSSREDGGRLADSNSMTVMVILSYSDLELDVQSWFERSEDMMKLLRQSQAAERRSDSGTQLLGDVEKPEVDC